MGCDIHLFLEILDRDGKWVPAQATFDEVINAQDNGDFIDLTGPGKGVAKTFRPTIPHADMLYRDRDYEVFGWLAGVRKPENQRFEPRGLPKDIHPITKELLSNEHTPSWLGVDEVLNAIDEAEDKHTKVVVSGMMDRKGLVRVKKRLAAMRAKREPVDFWKALQQAKVHSYCAWSSSPTDAKFALSVDVAPELKRFKEAMVKAAQYRRFDHRTDYPKDAGEYDDKHKHYSGKGARIVFDFDS